MDNVRTVCEWNDELEYNNLSSNYLPSLDSIPNQRGFQMAFLNIVSLPPKVDEIRFSTLNKSIDLVLIQRPSSEKIDQEKEVESAYTCAAQLTTK